MGCSGRLNPEALWFRSIAVIVMLIFVIVFIANTVYFDRARKGSCAALSVSEANTMFWLNLILSIIAVIMFIWSFIRLFFHPAARQEAVARAKLAARDAAVAAKARASVFLQQTDIGYKGNLVPTTTLNLPTVTPVVNPTINPTITRQVTAATPVVRPVVRPMVRPVARQVVVQPATTQVRVTSNPTGATTTTTISST